MGLSLNKIHPYKVQSGQTVMGKPNPALSLSQEGEAPIFIQGGKTYGSDGGVIERDKLPEWFWKQIKNEAMNPVVLEECGWKHTGRAPRARTVTKELTEALEDGGN